MDTVTIYESFGVLGHEKESVWGITPATEAYNEVTVRLPEGYGFCESSSGEILIEGDDGDVTCLTTALSKTGDAPFVYYPNPDGRTVRKVALLVVGEE